MKNAINIGNRREVFWDNYLIDEEKSTAPFRVCRIGERETVYTFEKVTEQHCISYPNIVKVPGGYRMYYVDHPMIRKPSGKGFLTPERMLESKDGINWTVPSLGIYEYEGSRDNNIVWDDVFDNFYVYLDENPNCPADEKYKAVGAGKYIDDHYGLYYYKSADGLHFTVDSMITDEGAFDTLNVVFWKDGRYCLYIRDYHESRQEFRNTNNAVDMALQEPATDQFTNLVRGIMVMYSEDFKTWTRPKHLEYADGLDEPLYTNNIEVYERAPHMFIGFPTRYMERRKWTENYDQLGGYKWRRPMYFSNSPREGLSVTDTIFMCSRDGEMWNRYNDTILTPGYENEYNWVYGDCYLGYKLVDTGEWFFYIYEIGHHQTYVKDVPMPLYRMKIRKDGFACREAGGEERVLVTKPLVFKGNELHLNFETSAYGYIIVDILDEDGNKLSEGQSFEVFGNNIDRRVMFEDGSGFEAYADKPVRLRFRMRDAKVYSFKFEA